MLEREARQDQVERAGCERVARPAQVDDCELIEVWEGLIGCVDVRPDQPPDPRTERAELGDAPAACVEDGDRPPRPIDTGLSVGDRVVERRLDQARDGRRDTEAFDDRLAALGRHAVYQAVAVAASVIPCASSQRSASIAALQPSPAAVTACR